jgi:DNA-binding CsgD family transcriptional regulator
MASDTEHHKGSPKGSPNQPDTVSTQSESLERNLLLFAAQEDVIDAVEITRRQLATELNQKLVSQMNLILAQLAVYEKTLPLDGEGQMALSVLGALVRQLLQQTLDLEASLHPTSLESLGLETALESLANQQRRIHGIRIALDIQRLPERVPQPIELALFRTAQEAVDRAIRLANASTILIRLRTEDRHIRFRVADDGIPPQSAVLRNAKRRILAFGGKATLNTGELGGLELLVDIDLEPEIDLTDREYDVIRLIANGLTNKEIAAALNIKPRTAKFHLDNIFSKLNVNTRTEAAIYALKRGLAQQKPFDPPD